MLTVHVCRSLINLKKRLKYICGGVDGSMMGFSMIGIIGILVLFVYWGGLHDGYHYHYCSEVGVLMWGGVNLLVSVHSRLVLFAGTSVDPGRISKSKLPVSYVSSYTGEPIILMLNLVGL